jgi:hypothetical protein
MMELHLDNPSGYLIGSIAIPNTGGWQAWQTVTGTVAGVTGIHDLYVVARGSSGIGNMNWFQFNGAAGNQAPLLPAITNQSVVAGETVALTNFATDADVPSQTLTYALVSAPDGAGIDPSTGVFTWRPAIAQSPSQQTIQIEVSDDGSPVRTATRSFEISVTRPNIPTMELEPVFGDAYMLSVRGQAGPDYTIQTSTNLFVWQPIVVTNPVTFPFTWPVPKTADSIRFYRVSLGP